MTERERANCYAYALLNEAFFMIQQAGRIAFQGDRDGKRECIRAANATYRARSIFEKRTEDATKYAEDDPAENTQEETHAQS